MTLRSILEETFGRGMGSSVPVSVPRVGGMKLVNDK